MTSRNAQKPQKVDTILGVKVSGMTKKALLKDVRERLTIKSSLFVTTPNPEIIMAAQADKALSKALNEADYALPDGIGVVAAHKYLRMNAEKSILKFPLSVLQGIGVGLSVFLAREWLTRDMKVIKGRLFAENLIALANDAKWRVYLLGGAEGEAEAACRTLKEKYSKAKFAYNAGPKLEKNGKPDTLEDITLQKGILRDIVTYKPHILLVAFGAPKQEKWISEHLEKLPVGLAMTVGGTFNYMSGKSKVPPKIFSSGFEWAWRLMTEPWRAARIFTATIQFPFAVFKEKITSS